MRLLIMPLAASAMLVCTGAAVARCPLSLPMRVGPVTGNPEKDTVGLFCAQPEPGSPVVAPGSGRPSARVGAVTGESEKDSIGFVASPGPLQAAR